VLASIGRNGGLLHLRLSLHRRTADSRTESAAWGALSAGTGMTGLTQLTWHAFSAGTGMTGLTQLTWQPCGRTLQWPRNGQPGAPLGAPQEHQQHQSPHQERQQDPGACAEARSVTSAVGSLSLNPSAPAAKGGGVSGKVLPCTGEAPPEATPRRRLKCPSSPPHNSSISIRSS